MQVSRSTPELRRAPRRLEPLGTAGRALLRPSSGGGEGRVGKGGREGKGGGGGGGGSGPLSRTPSPGQKVIRRRPLDEDKDDAEEEGGLSETLWRQHIRASIKARSDSVAGCLTDADCVRAASVRVTPGRHASLPKRRATLPPSPLMDLGGGASCSSTRESTPAARQGRTARQEDEQGVESQRRASVRKEIRCEARAHTDTPLDIISFLEMFKLSTSYMTSLKEHGVSELSQLLTMDNSTLDDILEKCHVDAMDEILLKDALRTARVDT